MFYFDFLNYGCHFEKPIIDMTILKQSRNVPVFDPNLLLDRHTIKDPIPISIMPNIAKYLYFFI